MLNKRNRLKKRHKDGGWFRKFAATKHLGEHQIWSLRKKMCQIFLLDHQKVGLQTGGPESLYGWVWRELPGDGHTKRGQDRRQFFRNQAAEWGETSSIIVQFHSDSMSMQYQRVVLHGFVLFIEVGRDDSEYLSWRKISFRVFALRFLADFNHLCY